LNNSFRRARTVRAKFFTGSIRDRIAHFHQATRNLGAQLADSRGSAEGTFLLDPRYAQRLRQAVPDLNDWPRSWHVESADIFVGQQIALALMPFLFHLLDQRLAKATLSQHRDNLWTLGGELIRCRYDDDDLAKTHVKDALRRLTRGDAGPLMWPRITESEQDSLDTICRKLSRFLRESAAADPSDRRNDWRPRVRRRRQCRVVHGGGRSALATNRPTDAGDNSSQMLRIAPNRPQTVRKNRISYPPGWAIMGLQQQDLASVFFRHPAQCSARP